MEYCNVNPHPIDAPNYPPPNGGGGEHPQFISAPRNRREQTIVFSRLAIATENLW